MMLSLCQPKSEKVPTFLPYCLESNLHIITIYAMYVLGKYFFQIFIQKLTYKWASNTGKQGNGKAFGEQGREEHCQMH